MSTLLRRGCPECLGVFPELVRYLSGVQTRVCTTGYLRLACALPIASSNKSLQAKYALPFALPVKKKLERA